MAQKFYFFGMVLFHHSYELTGYPAEVGALFTTVPVLGLVGLVGLVGLSLRSVSGIALNKYRCE